MQWALPPREAGWVERVSFACLALMMALLAYGVVQTVPVWLWRAQPLPDPPLPLALLFVVAGAPLVLMSSLLMTGSLRGARRWRVAGGLTCFVGAVVLAPHSFFQSLPDPLVTPFVFHVITEVSLLLIVAAVALVAPRGASWALALCLAHAIVSLRVDELPFAGPSLAPAWILARDGPLLATLVLLAVVLAREASKSRAA